MPTYKTAESVSPKHPDKICDQISDAILDAHLKEDPDARVAVDVAGGHGTVFITGEVTSGAKNVDVGAIVRRIAGPVEVIEHIALQSLEIAQGVDGGGAGDQGIMVGYATNETPEFLPLEVVLSRKLNQFLYQRWPFDGKTQVTTLNGKIHTIVASFQNAPTSKLEEAVKEWKRMQAIASSHSNVVYHINPAGDWKVGGFDADAGLTGRKLAVDNYGPSIPVGGGAFSGKDASKVDRSGAYIARKIAIDYLKKFQAHEVYVTLAYAIGFEAPLQAVAIVDGVEREVEGYDLSPNGIVEYLDLKQPVYEKTAAYGHFGHEEFTWETS
ncbi:methionine adenosyltransferase domain-containing protein [Candidatus Saccharibacteria bacterium]|nr:methionine adenosyltransferase domain-containing protein [Candidatus Saccharibacteria bacterium]